MTDKHLFLTENRRDVLAGASDWEDQSIANEKTRIRNRSRLALSELIEVAESPEIDNADVFDPGDVIRLLEALTDAGGLEPPVESDGYRDDLRARIGSLVAHMYAGSE